MHGGIISDEPGGVGMFIKILGSNLEIVDLASHRAEWGEAIPRCDTMSNMKLDVYLNGYSKILVFVLCTSDKNQALMLYNIQHFK